MRCAFSAKSLMTVWRSPFSFVSFYWPFFSRHQWRWTVIWLGFIYFPFTITPTVCKPKRIHILSHLLLFISRFTVTAKQILLFFLPSIFFSFFFFLLFTIGHNIFLPFVRFLWSSITIWFFNIRKDSYLFCSCQQKGALLHVPVAERTTVTLKLFWLVFLHQTIAIS